MTGYWFAFFKLQERVYCFLPSQAGTAEPYNSYSWMFGAVTICKLISMIYKIIYEQCAYDIFLVDWERPKYFE